VALLTGVVIVVTFAGSARFSSDRLSIVPDEPNRPVDATWVATDPVQCRWTPWELDWWESHGNDSWSHLRDFEEERAVIVAHFERLGITVLDVDVEVFAEAVLAVCGAARGYTVYLLVHDSDLDAMVGVGFRVVER